MMKDKIKAVVLVGPTASGKTALSCSLAEKGNMEIVSADSMQIYRGFPIASATPTAEEKGNIPHHLFEFLEPNEPFSVADYVTLATATCEEIVLRGKTPLIVGGTGLYVDSLLKGISFEEEAGSEEMRSALKAEADRLGGEAMLEQLRKIDPLAAEKLHPHDEKRILRGLEVYRLHGITPTEMNQKALEKGSRFEATLLGITYRDRERLYDRINRRVDLMVEHGLLEEAGAMRGTLGATATQAIGHKELYPYFDGERSLEESVEALKQATRRYAKRQLTWFRRNEEIHWIYADETPDVLAEAERILKEEEIL